MLQIVAKVILAILAFIGAAYAVAVIHGKTVEYIKQIAREQAEELVEEDELATKVWAEAELDTLRVQMWQDITQILKVTFAQYEKAKPQEKKVKSKK